jgi:hypothetical protein
VIQTPSASSFQSRGRHVEYQSHLSMTLCNPIAARHAIWVIHGLTTNHLSSFALLLPDTKHKPNYVRQRNFTKKEGRNKEDSSRLSRPRTRLLQKSRIFGHIWLVLSCVICDERVGRQAATASVPLRIHTPTTKLRETSRESALSYITTYQTELQHHRDQVLSIYPFSSSNTFPAEQTKRLPTPAA